MRIGIDISQIVYEGTGVARYVRRMVEELVNADTKNDYVLFGSSLRKRNIFKEYFDSIHRSGTHVRLVTVPIPQTVLEILWNKLHIVPIEWFIGFVDIFWSSDWTQPPLKKAIGITTIHDVSYLRYPESFDKKIFNVQNRRLHRVKEDCSMILCDSIATQSDVMQFLKIPKEKTKVIYPGFSL